MNIFRQLTEGLIFLVCVYVLIVSFVLFVGQRLNAQKRPQIPSQIGERVIMYQVITDPLEQVLFWKQLFSRKSVANNQADVKGSAGLREHEIKEK